MQMSRLCLRHVEHTSEIYLNMELTLDRRSRAVCSPMALGKNGRLAKDVEYM